MARTKPLGRWHASDFFWHFDKKIDCGAFGEHQVCRKEHTALGEIFRLRATLRRIRTANPNPERSSEVMTAR